MKLLHTLLLIVGVTLALANFGKAEDTCRAINARYVYGWNLNCVGDCPESEIAYPICSEFVWEDALGRAIVCACGFTVPGRPDVVTTPPSYCCQLAKRASNGQIVLSTFGDCPTCHLPGACVIVLSNNGTPTNGDTAQAACR